MNQNAPEAAAQAAPGQATANIAKPAPKPRSPRRMAREGNADALPVAPGVAAPDSRKTPPKPAGESKIARVIALLGREQGATLAELTQATGWLPHTTRATLTGLRKKGRTIEKTKRGDATCYKLAEGA